MADFDPDNWVVGKTDDLHLHYKLGRQLGSPGQFGVAHVATHLASGEERAVKTIFKGKFHGRDRRFYMQELRDEITVMKNMGKHANVITFFEVFEDTDNVHLVLELCRGGELFDRISERGQYSEKDASVVLRQMVQAVQYLHDQNIAHCDIKPDNFLFTNRDEDSTLKIIDFGMSKVLKPRAYLRKLCGTPYYVAPEVLQSRYNKACDMWSIGVVMFVMLFGFPPFYADPEKYKAMTDQKIFSLVLKGFDPTTKAGYGPWFPQAYDVSPDAKDLMAKLLKTNVADRYTAEEALSHPWLKGDTARTSPLDASIIKSLKTFDAGCKFKVAVLKVMADTLTDDAIASLKATFRAIDKNGDGNITVEELREALQNQKADAGDLSQINKIFHAADVDKNGVLSYEELLMVSVKRRLDAKEERLWHAFRKFDLDGDGKITRDELKQVLGGDADADIKEIIGSADTDGDGTVDYEEFLQMWNSKKENDITAF